MIYLAGKITASKEVEQQQNILRFYKKADELRKLGLKVYNPCEGERPGLTHAQYLAFDLKWIHDNKPDTIYLMKGWESSEGAQEEYETALLLGMNIIHEA